MALPHPDPLLTGAFPLLYPGWGVPCFGTPKHVFEYESMPPRLLRLWPPRPPAPRPRRLRLASRFPAPLLRAFPFLHLEVDFLFDVVAFLEPAHGPGQDLVSQILEHVDVGPV